MLGRSYPAMRVHVSAVPLRSLGALLRDIHWAGEPRYVVANMRMLLDHVEHAVVCLDVVGDAVVRIGVEGFFARSHGLDPRWRSLLDALVAHRLCAPEKADGLLAWPGVVTPL